MIPYFLYNVVWLLWLFELSILVFLASALLCGYLVSISITLQEENKKEKLMKMLRLVSFYPEKGILHLFFHENS